MPKSKLNKKKKIKIRGSLNPLREKLNVLTTKANQLVAELHEAGVSEQSRALSEARRTAIRFHSEDEGTLFTSNLPRAVDIGREMARVQQFLGDVTSTPSGVISDSVVTAQHLFGGQYRADGGYGANPDYVDKDTAEKVFEVYRKALESQGGWQRVMGWLGSRSHGLQDYGSENLITAIYDMIISGSDNEIYSSMEDTSGGALTDEERINRQTGREWGAWNAEAEDSLTLKDGGEQILDAIDLMNRIDILLKPNIQNNHLENIKLWREFLNDMNVLYIN